ncbi:flagellar basal body-associated FliL family protein [Halalkalibacter alkaliphilus]|uniref:Flagellar protein FliL n=1 Tax=Halalkalibacter alkaliphilus TaxID=2917993 RepID=A0A9X2A4D6_9BACI|nr:flagellar basal body-associated FliL family protein [Halalkalibacter alkaliphilus]MCL7746717.1 flagellar basal body-associated FliL family protein [Halalkalibacter alkaliphilus]
MQKVIITILLTLVIGLSGVVYFLMSDRPPSSNELATLEDRVFHTDRIVISIQNRSHLQLSLAIETDSKRSRSELQSAYPLIENKLIHSLSSLERSEIQSEDGIDLIETTILASISPLLTTGEVRNVYVTGKVLQ